MRGKDAAERAYPEDTSASEDAASRCPARLGGTRLHSETGSNAGAPATPPRPRLVGVGNERLRCRGYPALVDAENYSSGDDIVVEFLRLRFSFNAADFAQRVSAAAFRLGIVDDNELDADETEDLVELTADGVIEEPRSELGRYLVRHWERLSLVAGESLVYWLRKLVFRGAWLDHRVKDGRLDVAWDDGSSDFTYLEPGGERALLELAPTPSWHELQFRR